MNTLLTEKNLEDTLTVYLNTEKIEQSFNLKIYYIDSEGEMKLENMS